MRFMEFCGLISLSVLTPVEFSSVEEGTFEREEAHLGLWCLKTWVKDKWRRARGDMLQSAAAVGCLGRGRGSVVVHS